MLWRILIASLLVSLGCSSSSERCSDEAFTCFDSCCTPFEPTGLDDSCEPICPTGTSVVDRCAPAPSCSGCDAGIPFLECFRGDCCDPVELTDLIIDGCNARCPSGSSTSCTPAPSCDAPEWDECTTNSDCELAAAGCCLPCGEVGLSDVRGINESQRDEYFSDVCPEGAACPPCAPPPFPWLQATCNAGRCEAVDVRELPITECTRDEECRLRVTQCCECGGDVRPEALIAIAGTREGFEGYEALVCDLGMSCGGCLTPPPDSHEAYCNSGVCDVRAVP
ncbi:MAG: hypothetical protein AAGE52_26130 [Myxococcota bacterium]